MRKYWLFAAAWLALGAIAFAWLRQATAGPAASADATAWANLPVVFRPENTPTPAPTPTQAPRPTRRPPPDGNWITNGSFEGGWTNLPPAPGNLINQQPNGWTLNWLQPGTLLWDDALERADGVPECLHKLNWQLPPDEQLGGPNALILDGGATYKMFHAQASFGSQLRQRVENLPAGTWRLTVPVQVHTRNSPDPWSSESGVWVLEQGEQAGGWVNAGTMGDHQWFRHVVEFETGPGQDVEVLVRVKSKWAGRDFFIDAITLEQIDGLSTGGHRQVRSRGVLWLSRPLADIPADELVRPD